MSGSSLSLEAGFRVMVCFCGYMWIVGDCEANCGKDFCPQKGSYVIGTILKCKVAEPFKPHFKILIIPPLIFLQVLKTIKIYFYILKNKTVYFDKKTV